MDGIQCLQCGEVSPGPGAFHPHAIVEEAAREREILDRVHEHQHGVHKFHVARQEQKWMDELAAKMKRGLLAAI